jgi:N-acetylmuramoyl-L-alanine amidase
MFKIMQKNVEKMTINYSPNFDLKKRHKNEIKFLIFHYTGMKNDKLAIKKLTSFNSNVSCHYYITSSGKLIKMVPDLYVAWHAGKSNWKNDKSLNHNSIGIEISNPGHYHGYRKFNDKQIRTLIEVSQNLIKKYKINKKNILGHSDIAPLRKLDPGEKFPWKTLSKNKIGIWHNVSYKKEKLFRDKISEFNLIDFRKYLIKIGYRIDYKNSFQLKKLTKIFQMRFRPEKVDGKLDFECYMIAKSLKNLQ